MQNHEEVIENYRQADFDHRLSLFLEYPTFRNAFVRIDQGENKIGGKSRWPSVGVRVGRRWKKMWSDG